VYKKGEELIDASASIQELLEAVINSNTKDNLIFILSQDEGLIHIVSTGFGFGYLQKSNSNLQLR
jgi:hypothetical protein